MQVVNSWKDIMLNDIIELTEGSFLTVIKLRTESSPKLGVLINNNPVEERIDEFNWQQIKYIKRLGIIVYSKAVQDHDCTIQPGFDFVNKPKHYTDKPIETIDVLKNELSPEEFKGFLRGNVLKYVSRYQKKAGVQDLEKAQWYLTKLIEEEKQ